MSIKSFLRRLNQNNTASDTPERDDFAAMDDAEAAQQLVAKSELTILFQTILEEKQNDLPLRRTEGLNKPLRLSSDMASQPRR